MCACRHFWELSWCVFAYAFGASLGGAAAAGAAAAVASAGSAAAAACFVRT
jgi:hypothetical protein